MTIYAAKTLDKLHVQVVDLFKLFRLCELYGVWIEFIFMCSVRRNKLVG